MYMYCIFTSMNRILPPWTNRNLCQRHQCLIFFTFLVGAHLKQEVSTVSTGLRYCALLTCSSTSFGVTQITCCPFQYLIMLRDCSVLMMSSCVILVIVLQERGNKIILYLCWIVVLSVLIWSSSKGHAFRLHCT